eukprot:Skav201552  [mRNA]  locus=scaffold1616:294165:295065:- [translate_table: standard]
MITARLGFFQGGGPAFFFRSAGYFFVPTSPRVSPRSLKNSSVLFSSLLYIISTCQFRGTGRRVRKTTAANFSPLFSKTLFGAKSIVGTSLGPGQAQNFSKEPLYGTASTMPLPVSKAHSIRL